MAAPQPCLKCQKLVAQNKHERLRGILERMKRRPDIGYVPDIGREAEYQCIICAAIFIRLGDAMSGGWRFRT
ncbi:MAG TPA: hypothetical protein VK434_18925 [Microvirga sp.]|nr:hypothetical protein [Microvirga sp.]